MQQSNNGGLGLVLADMAEMEKWPVQPPQPAPWPTQPQEHHLQEPLVRASSSNSTATRPSKDRPCDACRRRKTRCVKDDCQDKCVLCNFHHQECTYLHEPVARNRKRKSPNPSGQEPPSRKAKSSRSRKPVGSGIEEYDEYSGETILRKTLGLMHKHHAHFVGLTGPFSFPRFSLPIGTSQKNVQSGQVSVRKVDRDTIFTISEDQGTVGHDSETSRVEALQEIIGPHGRELVDLYFRVVHPSFPIMHKGVYIEKYERSYHEFTAASLGAVYLLGSLYWAYSPVLSEVPKPDMTKVWSIALESFDFTIFRPKLSSVQAGLLLAQYESTDGGVVSNGSRGKLTAHLISVAHKVGLHLDPTDWDLPAWEVALRRRLGWALYMQDKWVALVEGRPALISNLNWMVTMCQPRDFPEYQEHEEEGSSEVEKGRTIFIQMIKLTLILSDLLDSVFSLRAHHDINKSPDPLRALLHTVQPLQERLKQWYGNMRETLRMDNATAMKLSSAGYLRLAYLALEVSIHRRIICQMTSGADVDPELFHVCRSAARARFLSALEFVNSLKAHHLTSFWYFSSSPCLTIIISFGNLLLGSAVDSDERHFYLTKLKEFRWTLKINGEAGAKFMKPALAAMMVNPDELCRPMTVDSYSMGESPATSTSRRSVGLSPATGFDGAAYGGPTGVAVPAPTATGMELPSTGSWQGASHGFHGLINPMPNMQEYLDAFSWMPPAYEGNVDQHYQGT